MANVYVRSGAAGTGTGADWTNAYTTLAAAFTAKAAGDIFWVADDHAETQASALTMTAPATSAAPCFVYCVDRTGSVPPVSADLRTTATITTTGANAQIIAGAGATYYYGINFQCGSGAVNSSISVTATHATFKNCLLGKLGTTGNTSAVTFSSGGRIVLDNTSVKFGSTGDGVRVGTNLVWRNTAAPISGATLPTTFFGSIVSGVTTLEAVDLSALGSGKTIIPATTTNHNFVFKDCAINSAVTLAVSPSSFGGPEIYVVRTAATGINYTEQKYTYAGTMSDELVIVRTGGASDGVTAKSRKIVTTANSKYVLPFEPTPIAVWQDSTAAATATIEGITNAAALPVNDEIWFDLEYLGASGTPLGSYATGTKADPLATGSALTASTQAWDSLATARANSTAYSLGDVRKVASNSGRLFFCTTAGTTAASEPGGYASAVDGGSVTDGSAVFRAAMRFKQTISFTAAQKGYVYAYLKAAKASTTYYIDPKITLA